MNNSINKELFNTTKKLINNYMIIAIILVVQSLVFYFNNLGYNGRGFIGYYIVEYRGFLTVQDLFKLAEGCLWLAIFSIVYTGIATKIIYLINEKELKYYEMLSILKSKSFQIVLMNILFSFFFLPFDFFSYKLLNSLDSYEFLPYILLIWLSIAKYIIFSYVIIHLVSKKLKFLDIIKSFAKLFFSRRYLYSVMYLFAISAVIIAIINYIIVFSFKLDSDVIIKYLNLFTLSEYIGFMRNLVTFLEIVLIPFVFWYTSYYGLKENHID